MYGIGDPSLRSEITWAASPSVALSLPWLHAEVGAFAQRIDRYIVFGPVLTETGAPAIDVTTQGSFLRYAYTQTDAQTWGLEGQLDLELGPVFSATLAGSRIRTSERGTGAYLPFVPPDQGTLTLAAEPVGLGDFDGTRFALSATHIARQTRWSPATDLVEPPPAVTRFDAAVDVPVGLAGDRDLLLGLAVTNLFDARIRTYTSLLRPFADEPGRDVRVRGSLLF